jgi:predicted dehydrogenase
MLDVVLVGAGYIAQAEHIPGWLGRADARLTAVVDPRRDVAAGVGAALAIPSFVAVADALSSVPCQAVHVCSPPATHLDLIREAVAAGIHILVEKPLALDVASATLAVEAADAAGVTLMVGAPRRFDRGVQWLLDTVRSGALGEPVAAASRWAISRPAAFTPYFEAPRTSFGGYAAHGLAPVHAKLLEESIHHLAVLRDLVAGGEVRAMDAVAGEVLHVTMTAEGVLLTHTNSTPWLHEESFVVTGTEATATVTPWSPHFPESFPSVQLRPRAGGQAVPALMPVNPYFEQIRHFRAVVAGEEPPVRAPGDSVRDLALIEEISGLAEKVRP